MLYLGWQSRLAQNQKTLLRDFSRYALTLRWLRGLGCCGNAEHDRKPCECRCSRREEEAGKEEGEELSDGTKQSGAAGKADRQIGRRSNASLCAYPADSESEQFLIMLAEMRALAFTVRNRKIERPITLEDAAKSKVIFDTYIVLKAVTFTREEMQKVAAGQPQTPLPE